MFNFEKIDEISDQFFKENLIKSIIETILQNIWSYF